MKFNYSMTIILVIITVHSSSFSACLNDNSILFDNKDTHFSPGLTGSCSYNADSSAYTLKKSTGFIIAIIRVKNNIRHGKSQYFIEDLGLVQEITHSDGILEGEYKTYDKQGNITYSGKYINGKKSGKSYAYSNKGVLRYTKYHANDKVIKIIPEESDYNIDGLISLASNFFCKNQQSSKCGKYKFLGANERYLYFEISNNLSSTSFPYLRIDKYTNDGSPTAAFVYSSKNLTINDFHDTKWSEPIEIQFSAFDLMDRHMDKISKQKKDN